MDQYKKLFVTTEPEEEAFSLIRFAARISLRAGSEEVNFFHLSDKTGLPAELCTTVEDHPSSMFLFARMARQLGFPEIEEIKGARQVEPKCPRGPRSSASSTVSMSLGTESSSNHWCGWMLSGLSARSAARRTSSTASGRQS